MLAKILVRLETAGKIGVFQTNNYKFERGHNIEYSPEKRSKQEVSIKLDQGRICGQMQDVSTGKGQPTFFKDKKHFQ